MVLLLKASYGIKRVTKIHPKTSKPFLQNIKIRTDKKEKGGEKFRSIMADKMGNFDSSQGDSLFGEKQGATEYLNRLIKPENYSIIKHPVKEGYLVVTNSRISQFKDFSLVEHGKAKQVSKPLSANKVKIIPSLIKG